MGVVTPTSAVVRIGLPNITVDDEYEIMANSPNCNGSARALFNVVHNGGDTVIITPEGPEPGTPGTSGIEIVDYTVSGGNNVVLTLNNGTNGQECAIVLRQGSTVVGTLTAPYASTLTVESSQYGYCDVYVDNTDIGSVYIPQQLSGGWTVQKAKSFETDVMDLQFAKVGDKFIVTDSVENGGWANVEYWHNSTLLGSSIPANYAVEPNTDMHITKKRWGNFFWLGYDADGLHRQLVQLTFKIVQS